MPWKEVTKVSLREEFIQLVLREDSNISALCQRYNISRKTGYKWIHRFLEEGEKGLHDRSRCPNVSPKKTSREIEERVLEVRDTHPAWGGRKIRRRLLNIGVTDVPSCSTITMILRRNGRLSAEESLKHKALTRFEAAQPNDLWQMDFKGWFQIKHGTCHPLTLLDDHSRFSLGIEACSNERAQTVQGRLVSIFRRYGMPLAILCDNGAPFGASALSPYTTLGAWILRLGIRLIHGRPLHPQTQGKEERFHRTLKAEVLHSLKVEMLDIHAIQKRFDAWRDVYNFERPHEALAMDLPIDRYSVSSREYPEVLPQIEYSPDDVVVKVRDGGRICYFKKEFRVGKAFTGEYVAIRPTSYDNVREVYYCNQVIKKLTL